MRVGIITQGASSVVQPILDHLDAEVVALVDSAPFGFSPGLQKTVRWRVRRLVQKIRTPNRMLDRLALRSSIPYFFLHRENLSEFAGWLALQRCDIVFVWSMSHLLPAEILSIPRLGMLNTHPAMLPDYRGPYPWYWLYHDQVARSGTTLHYLDEGEDTGDIVFQRGFDISPGMPLGKLQRLALGSIGIELVLEAISALGRGDTLPRVKQPALSSTRRARRISASEIPELINWRDWPINRIWHVLRGTEGVIESVTPPRGLYLGQSWSILEVESCSYGGDEAPGSVIKDDSGYAVVCGEGLIRLGVSLRPSQLFKHIARELLSLWNR
jgi:methionyl-tRNA formyltransferase